MATAHAEEQRGRPAGAPPAKRAAEAAAGVQPAKRMQRTPETPSATAAAGAAAAAAGPAPRTQPFKPGCFLPPRCCSDVLKAQGKRMYVRGYRPARAGLDGTYANMPGIKHKVCHCAWPCLCRAGAAAAADSMRGAQGQRHQDPCGDDERIASDLAAEKWTQLRGAGSVRTLEQAYAAERAALAQAAAHPGCSVADQPQTASAALAAMTQQAAAPSTPAAQQPGQLHSAGAGRQQGATPASAGPRTPAAAPGSVGCAAPAPQQLSNPLLAPQLWSQSSGCYIHGYRSMAGPRRPTFQLHLKRSGVRCPCMSVH